MHWCLGRSLARLCTLCVFAVQYYLNKQWFYTPPYIIHTSAHAQHFLVSIIFLSSRFRIYFCSFALFSPSFFSFPHTGLNFCHLLRSNQTHMVLVGQSCQQPTLLHTHWDASGCVCPSFCSLWESNNKLTKLRAEIPQSHPVNANNWL